MKKKKRSKLLAVLLVMATGTSLLSGCGRKIAEKKESKAKIRLLSRFFKNKRAKSLFHNNLMEHFFALLDNGFAIQRNDCLRVCYFFIVDGNAALLYQPASFTIGGTQSSLYHQSQNADSAIL